MTWAAIVVAETYDATRETYITALNTSDEYLRLKHVHVRVLVNPLSLSPKPIHYPPYIVRKRIRGLHHNHSVVSSFNSAQKSQPLPTVLPKFDEVVGFGESFGGVTSGTKFKSNLLCIHD